MNDKHLIASVSIESLEHVIYSIHTDLHRTVLTAEVKERGK